MTCSKATLPLWPQVPFFVLATQDLGLRYQGDRESGRTPPLWHKVKRNYPIQRTEPEAIKVRWLYYMSSLLFNTTHGHGVPEQMMLWKTFPFWPGPRLPLTPGPHLPLTPSPHLPSHPVPTSPHTWSRPPLTPGSGVPLTPGSGLPLIPGHNLPLTPGPSLPSHLGPASPSQLALASPSHLAPASPSRVVPTSPLRPRSSS